MKFDKDDTAALATTVIIHLILLLLLYFGILKTIIPNEDSGILVNFGDVSASIGVHEPQYTERTAQKEVPPPAAPKTTPPAEKELITQEEEESVAIPDKKKIVKKEEVANNRAKAEKERQRKDEEERRRKEEEQKRQQEAISNRVSNAFGMASATQSQQGDATAGKGNQGNPFGNADTGASEGVGGFGTFNLDGRSIGSGGLPRPQYNGQEEGRIVIAITVDPNGNVIAAEIGKGTNIDNAAMRRSAQDAAKRAKFNKIQGTKNAYGTITYRYKLT